MPSRNPTSTVGRPAPTTACLRRRLHALGDPGIAVFLQGYFKTGPGGYGAGDRFIGVRVPAVRTVAREGRRLPEADVLRLLASRVHEERLLALLILVDQYARGSEPDRRRIYALCLAHTRFINNWDLVDTAAPGIVGAHLERRSRRPLERLARSADLWERRIAIVATYHFIRHSDFGPTLHVAELLLNDPYDLIHKAAGWMLREVGKRDRAAADAFLQAHHADMPRTMLRYAIERLPEAQRRQYLQSGRRSGRRTTVPAGRS